MSHRFRAMGSDVHVLFPERAPECANAVERLFEEWEDVLSRFRPGSELSRLNDRAGAPVRVGPILLAVVEASLAAARATGGLFDPTLRHELVRMQTFVATTISSRVRSFGSTRPVTTSLWPPL